MVVGVCGFGVRGLRGLCCRGSGSRRVWGCGLGERKFEPACLYAQKSAECGPSSRAQKQVLEPRKLLESIGQVCVKLFFACPGALPEVPCRQLLFVWRESQVNGSNYLGLFVLLDVY